MPGIWLTHWTIRLALTCYLAYLAGWLVARDARWPAIGRWIWTAGCGLFVLHVVCAMAFYHHWSHAAAFDKTARETQELLGFSFGGGIYFSYVFLLLWLADVLWSWLAPVSYFTRPLWIAASVHVYLLFIAANGAMVFESGPTRWGGIAGCLLLAGLGVWRWSRFSRREVRPDVSLDGHMN